MDNNYFIEQARALLSRLEDRTYGLDWREGEESRLATLDDIAGVLESTYNMGKH